MRHFQGPLLAELSADLLKDDNETVRLERVDNPRLRWAQAMSVIAEDLWCQACEGADADVRALSGVRLGWRERRILCAAPGSEEKRAIVAPESADRAADEAHRRALRKLERVGLVDLERKKVRGECRHPLAGRFAGWERRNGQLVSLVWREDLTRRTTVWKRTVRLSPLGAAVVQRLGPELQAARRIRWARVRDDLLESCRWSLPRLLKRLKAEVDHSKGFEEWRLGYFKLTAALPRQRPPTAEQVEDFNADFERLTRRIEIRDKVLSALERPCKTVEEREELIRTEAACPRCGQLVAKRFAPPGCDVSLCGPCYSALTREWVERTAAGGQ